MNKFLRVNLTTKQAVVEPIPEAYKCLGGRGLTARIMLDEVSATCDALGKNNKLIFAVGLLAGSAASSTNRISVGTKSPLTGGIKEANGGGMTGYNLAKLGFRAIILEGIASEPTILHVDKQGNVSFESAEDVWGKETYDVMEVFLAKYPKHTAYALIGPAGEMKMNIAGVANTDMEGHPTRYAARGGVGAVMGSKNLKAIVLENAEKSAKVADDEDLWKVGVKKYTKAIQSTPTTATAMPNFGTPTTMEMLHGLGGALSEGFRCGQVHDINAIGGNRYHDMILERGGCGSTTHGCMPGCIVKCSSIFPNEDGSFCNTPLEYENMGLLGSNLGIEDLDKVNRMNHRCNQLGIDTIETGGALSAAAEAGFVKYGDYETFSELIEEIGKGSPMGRLLGLGAAGFAKAYGVTRVITPKGQTIAAYDPRAIKVNGITYVTNPMGGDHTAGNGIFLKVNHVDPAGKVKESFDAQVVSGWVDSVGICTFLRAAHFTDVTALGDMLKARYGGEWTPARLSEMGRETLRTEILFNRAAGIPDVSDYPDFVKEESLPPLDATWNIDETELKNIWKPLFE